MAEYGEYVKKQIKKEITHLKDQYGRLKRGGTRRSSSHRLKDLERQLLKHNPHMKINYELLRLVGTEPYNPPSQDKEIVRRIVAERYG